MNEQQKIQYIAHTISPTILNSIITTFFSFFLNTFQRSTEYLSRAKGKKYRTSEASTGDFLPGEWNVPLQIQRAELPLCRKIEKSHAHSETSAPFWLLQEFQIFLLLLLFGNRLLDVRRFLHLLNF